MHEGSPYSLLKFYETNARTQYNHSRLLIQLKQNSEAARVLMQTNLQALLHIKRGGLTTILFSFALSHYTIKIGLDHTSIVSIFTLFLFQGN